MDPTHKNPGGIDAQGPSTLLSCLSRKRSDDGSWNLEWSQVTGAALRRGHAAIQCSDRRTHLGEVIAHRATAARAATLTAVWSSVVDAGAATEMASH
jgi:hypothetical protein